MKNKSNTSNLLSSIPLLFEKNVGQQDSEVRYILRQNGCTMFFTQNEVVSVFSKKKEKNNNDSNDRGILQIDLNVPRDKDEYEISLLRMNLEKCNVNAEITGEDEINCKGNYFKGSKEDWITDVDLYEKIIYKDIYENIDLVYYSNKGSLEYDFILKAEANLEDIKIIYEGMDDLEIDDDGNLKIDIKDSSVYLLKPKTYQIIDEDKVEVRSEFAINDNKVSFKIGNYDKERTLVIDPILLYSTYIGGNDYEEGRGIAVDNYENAYITGYTSSFNFPTTPNAYKTVTQGYYDVFITKIDTKLSGSSSLIYSSYIGGGNYEEGRGIAVDSHENAYITGYTSSTNFTTTPNAYQAVFQGNYDAFITKIDTKLSGSSSLKYSSYIGGSDYEYGNGVAVDDNENAYITGYTFSTNFPTTPNAYQTTPQGNTEVFITKIDTKLSGSSSLLYSSYIGGSSEEYGNGIAIDDNENAYITGYTFSTNFPTTPNAYQTRLKGNYDVFLTKIDTKLSGSSSLKYSTFIGGMSSEYGNGIVLDSNENAYITGYTFSYDFPVTSNAYQRLPKGSSDAFITKIDTKESGSNSLKYSTYIGGNDSEYGFGIAVDNNENAYITGYTYSTDFPITSNAYQAVLLGNSDAFITKIDTKQSGINSLWYSTYIGGTSYEEGRGIGVDNNENVYVTGNTSSSDFPTTPNAFQSSNGGYRDAFLLKIDKLLGFIDLQMNKVTNLQFADIGTTITYRITLNNSGNVSASNIIFIDTIPDGTTFIPNSLNINGTTVTQSPAPPSGVNIGNINVGATSTVIFQIKVDTIPSINSIENSATSTYTYTKVQTIPNGEIGSSNSNIVTTKVNHVNVVVNKTTNPVYVNCNDTIVYTLILKNIGNVTANNVIIRDTIPNQTKFVSNSFKVNGTTMSGQNPWVGVNIGSIGPNSIKTVTFNVIAKC